MSDYKFYSGALDGGFEDSYEDALLIAPMVCEVVGVPRSIVDLGGGVGQWCSAFRRLGARSVVCIDNPQTFEGNLRVNPGEFIGVDLAVEIPPPILSDLAICLEFAEHVELAMSSAIVSFLVRSAPIVLFSAAIPAQTGVHHVNEQPPSFWRELFRAHNYEMIDAIRPLIINRADISYWYRQNMFLYAAGESALALKEKCLPFRSIPEDFELVHSSVLRRHRAPAPKAGLRQLFRAFPGALSATVDRISSSRRGGPSVKK